MGRRTLNSARLLTRASINAVSRASMNASHPLLSDEVFYRVSSIQYPVSSIGQYFAKIQKTLAKLRVIGVRMNNKYQIPIKFAIPSLQVAFY